MSIVHHGSSHVKKQLQHGSGLYQEGVKEQDPMWLRWKGSYFVLFNLFLYWCSWLWFDPYWKILLNLYWFGVMFF